MQPGVRCRPSPRLVLMETLHTPVGVHRAGWCLQEERRDPSHSLGPSPHGPPPAPAPGAQVEEAQSFFLGSGLSQEAAAAQEGPLSQCPGVGAAPPPASPW